MEVLAKDKSDSPVLLSNVEVIHLLNDRMKNRNDKRRKNQNPNKNKYKHRDWIEEQVLEYLKTTPCVNLENSRRESFQSTLMSSKKRKSSGNMSSTKAGFELTKAEALQVLNFMPTEKVEIHLMVEELHTRMIEDRQDELLEYIQSQRTEKQGLQEERQHQQDEAGSEVVDTTEGEDALMYGLKEEI